MIEAALRAAILAHVPELAAAVRAEIERPRLLPIKSACVSYRAILEGEKRGELQVYRIGNASLIDESELYDWIRRVGVKATPQPEQQGDELGELIELQDGKRKRAAGGGR
jgi:hypothetical protein